MTVTNSEIGAYTHSLSDVGTPATDDELLVYDVSATATKKVQASALAGVGGGSPAGAVLDYAEFTAAVSVTATTEGTANTVKAGASVSYDGATAVMVEFWCPYVQPANGQHNVVLVLLEDTTVLGITNTSSESTTQRTVGHIMRKRTPSAGSHTYAVKAYVDSGTGTVGAGAGGSAAYLPGFLIVRQL